MIIKSIKRLASHLKDFMRQRLKTLITIKPTRLVFSELYGGMILVKVERVLLATGRALCMGVFKYLPFTLPYLDFQFGHVGAEFQYFWSGASVGFFVPI